MLPITLLQIRMTIPLTPAKIFRTMYSGVSFIKVSGTCPATGPNSLIFTYISEADPGFPVGGRAPTPWGALTSDTGAFQ